MMEIEKPKISILEKDRGHIKLVVEPLEKGFGITIGNCLRRTLLSALPGAAIQGIKFAPELGVKHELSTIEGVKEDVTEIVMNLKSINVKTDAEDEGYTKTLQIKKEGPCTVYASDIDQDFEIEILNPEQVICHVEAGTTFDAEIKIGRGRGYKGSVNNKTDEIGFIAIDSIYTPVEDVCYTVENARVGQNIDRDRLFLEVWTNKTISGEDVVSLAANIVIQDMRFFASLSDKSEVIVKDDKDDVVPQILDTSIDEMELSVRSYNCLKRANIHTIGDLTKKSHDDMLKVRNLGKKSLDEIEIKLNNYGLGFKKEED